MTNSNTTKTTGGKKAAPERNSAATEKRKTLPVNNIQPNAQKASPEDTARRIIAAADSFPEKGYSVIPVRRATKTGGKGWKEYEKRRMSPTEFKIRAQEIGADAIAIISGAVSGNLMALDFDNHDAPCVFDEWKRYVEETEAGKALFARLYVERSQSGGYHVMTRLEQMPDGLKKDVAFVEPAKPADAPQNEGDKAGKNAKREKWACVIEARGEGCYTLCAPSSGYTVIQGSPAEYPKITPDEWEILLTAAARCDKRPITGQEEPIRHEKAAYGKGWATAPGDDYSAQENALDEMVEMLLEDGWKYDRDGKLEDGTPCKHYTRPGKDEGTSGSVFVGKEGVPVFKCFTSNAAPFEYMGKYRPFAVYAMLKHNGDFTKAAAALHAKGYGEKEAGKKTPGANELAAGFLAEWDAARTVNGGHCLKMYRGAFYEFRRDSGWREISAGDFGGHIAEYLWKLKVDATAKRQSDIKAALAAPSLCRIPDSTETPVRISKRERLDPRKYIPVKNGIIRIPDGAKKPADLQLEPLTEDFFTPNALPVTFDPAAKCPVFLRYLKDVQPENREAESLQMMAGYMLTPDRSLNVFFALNGESNSGKSVFIKTMQKVLGPRNYSTLSYSQLTGKFENILLVGPLANFSTEMELDYETAKRGGTPEEALKKITGGEAMTVQVKHGDMYTAKPTALLVFATNNLPYIKDKTNAVYERLRILPFEQVISKNERDPRLPEKLENELSGVLNWMLTGFLKVREKNVFPETQRGKELSDGLRGDNNPLLDAVASTLVSAPASAVNSSEVYHRLQMQVEDAGYMKPGSAKIWREIQRQFPKVKKAREQGRGVTLIYGVKLRE